MFNVICLRPDGAQGADDCCTVPGNTRGGGVFSSRTSFAYLEAIGGPDSRTTNVAGSHRFGSSFSFLDSRVSG